MSAIAGLYNVPGTESEFLTWSFINAAHHRDIARVVYQLVGTVLPEFQLDPFDPNNPGVWLYQHQLMHQNQNEVLGIAGYDLLDVDWQNEGERAGWIQLHASEHYQAANILKIG